MRESRPFLEDGSQFRVSRTAFRRMRKAEKLELMIGWFHQNYEDPAQKTPYESAEGGYQWIWGGPYEARDELYSKFGDIVSESLIEEAVKEIESDGLLIGLRFTLETITTSPNRPKTLFRLISILTSRAIDTVLSKNKRLAPVRERPLMNFKKR
jgi:hypothetical protein